MRWESTAGAGSAARPAQVWRVLLDGRGWRQWMPAVEWMVLEGPPQAGSRLTIKPKGVRQTAFRIEELEPNRLLLVVVTIGPVAALRLRWQLEPEASGTAIVHTVAISGPLAGPLLGCAARKIAAAMPAVLERLAVAAVLANPGPPI